jgi:hypothetical protein
MQGCFPPTSAEAAPIVAPIATSRERHGVFGRLQIVALLALLAGIASIPGAVIFSTWATHRAMLREWVVKGPPCPVSETLSVAARGARPPPPFVYKGVGFAYQIGDAFCAAVPVEDVFSSKTFPVCNFDAPAAIAVTLGARHVLFEPGVGHAAWVTIRDGRISCVMGRGMRD